MNWTDQNVALLAKLWAEGLFTRQIAARLGYSNGAICGKITRLKLKRGDIPSSAKPVVIAPPPQPAATPAPRKRLDLSKAELRAMLAAAVRNTV
jgi:hypothetical protein